MDASLKNPVELVDATGNTIGTAPKIDVHLDGSLHRAVSVFIFDDNRRQLLQQRAKDKYHAPGLWSNACCSHPYPSESPRTAAERRLQEELGMEAELCEAFVMRYKADVGEGLVEHEYDHVFIARALTSPVPNPAEIMAVKWMSSDSLKRSIEEMPAVFTPWFRLAQVEVMNCLTKNNQENGKVVLTPEGDTATFLYEHAGSATERQSATPVSITL